MSPGLLNWVFVGKDCFNGDELHDVRSVVIGGKEMFCNCGLLFTVVVI